MTANPLRFQSVEMLSMRSKDMNESNSIAARLAARPRNVSSIPMITDLIIMSPIIVVMGNSF